MKDVLYCAGKSVWKFVCAQDTNTRNVDELIAFYNYSSYMFYKADASGADGIYFGVANGRVLNGELHTYKNQEVHFPALSAEKNNV